MSANTEFHALPVATVQKEAGGAVSITFDIPVEKAPLFAFKPGQHVAIRHMSGGEELRRNYSICAGPGESLRIAVKQISDGRFSTWANSELRPGMLLELMPPTGRFVLPVPKEASPRRILAVAAGAGITPILGIAKQALETERHTHVSLVYGNRSVDSILFGEEIENLKDRHLGRLDVVHVLSRDEATEVPLLQGRITGDKMRELSRSLIDPKSAAHIFICGPGSMIKDVRDALVDMGIEKAKIHHEFFAPGGGAYRKQTAAAEAGASRTASGSDAASEVVAILDGARTRFELEKGESVLAGALRAGVKAPYSCTGGMCSTCRARIVEGSAEMAINYSLEPWEVEKGFVLTCQSHPTSKRLVVDYDAM